MTQTNNSSKKRARKVRHEVVFYTYPKFLFCWPILVMGYVLWLLNRLQWGGPELYAWMWVITLVLVVMTIGFDLNRNFTIFWLAVLLLLWMSVAWFGAKKNIDIFSHIYHFFADLNPGYSVSLGLMVSIPLTVLYGIMWIWTRLNYKWRITHNEFEHYQFGRMDDSLARGAKRVRTSYPDFFEFLVFLAGDLVIYDSTGRRVLRRIPHVPLLPFVRRKINFILESTAVTVGELDDEAGEQAESEVEDFDADDESDRGV
ncbi:MAG: hypothetical protein JW709_04485 [Sedimentisphaerales bacterium]|nr:hypothetical protein [Sedimentisphaerales bacterium]